MSDDRLIGPTIVCGHCGCPEFIYYKNPSGRPVPSVFECTQCGEKLGLTIYRTVEPAERIGWNESPEQERFRKEENARQVLRNWK